MRRGCCKAGNRGNEIVCPKRRRYEPIPGEARQDVKPMRTHPNFSPTPAELILLEALARNTTIGVKLCDCSGAGCILYANDGFAELTGYSKEELTRSDCTLVVCPADKDKLLREIRTQTDTRGYFKITYQLKRKDGSLIWVLDSGVLVHQQNGQDIVQSVVADITAQKQAEQELEANKTRYEIALAFSDVMMFEYDIDTKTIFTQASDLTTYGLPGTIENGVETIIDSGIIQDRSKDDFRTMYQKINGGAPCASATIYVNDVKGNERTLQMQIVSFFDDEKKPIYTLGVRKDITDMVQLHKEKEYGSQLTEKHLFLYEANVTQNKILYFNPHWAHTVGLSDPTVFSKVVRYVCDAYVAPEDAAIFTEQQTQSFLLDSFKRGERLVEFEYRKRRGVDDKRYHWFEAKINIVQDEPSNDINVRVYSLNIDKKKEADSALLYQAQHDLMTGLYNKATTEDKIDAALSAPATNSHRHVFFIVDLDYFKLINDRFGHAFGDAVLSQAASKIADLFRAEDILGRIGGDEFVIFMKNVRTEKLAFLKAQEICDTLTETYQQNGRECKLTASVGIAISGQDGTTYDELYRHSDTALYAAKENGRNRFSFYTQGMQLGSTTVQEIDFRQVCEASTFEDNIGEYVFRILHESKNRRQAITSVLELVGKHYHVSRAYVFENSKDGTCLCNTFEWCNEGVASQLKNLAKIPYSKLGDYSTNFSKEGVFYLRDSSTAPGPLRKILESQGIKSLLQFPIIANGAFSGFVGFDEYTRFRVPEVREFNDYRNLANILSIFLTEMRAVEDAETAKDAALAIVNSLDSFAYVCDPATYQLLFINDKTHQRIPSAKIGQPCYSSLQGKEAPCLECPMRAMEEEGSSLYSDIHYNDFLDTTIKTTASWINWIGDTKGCIVNVIDTAHLKKTGEVPRESNQTGELCI